MSPAALRASLLDQLRSLAGPGQTRVDLGEAALLLAALELPDADLAAPRRHLMRLADDVAAEVAKGRGEMVGDAAALLSEIIAERHGYQGDVQSYEDLQNANLIQVIERRRGLPVALGILWLHAARAQGWEAEGLAFPGHFLLRLERPDGRLILDPFNEGTTPDAPALERLLRHTAGPGVALTADLCAPVADRDVLLRLQNNIKLRLLRTESWDAALSVVQAMLCLAPDESDLWREAGLLEAHCGRYGAAMEALGRACDLAHAPAQRARMVKLLGEIRGRLN